LSSWIQNPALESTVKLSQLCKSYPSSDSFFIPVLLYPESSKILIVEPTTGWTWLKNPIFMDEQPAKTVIQIPTLIPAISILALQSNPSGDLVINQSFPTSSISILVSTKNIRITGEVRFGGDKTIIIKSGSF